MPTREQLQKELDALPDDQLENAADEDSEPTFEERLRKLAETFAGMDFLPREEAWR
jgi:hypothetical protein